MKENISKKKEPKVSLSKVEKQLSKQNKILLDEVENKTSELIKSERLATIGTMSSRIAHDLKQPLTVMQTYADMLTPEIILKLNYSDKQKWSRIQNSILDMSRIIEDVLDFARTTEIKKKSISFQSVLKLAMNHVKSSYGIIINLPEKDFKINCDARKIEGVLSNIVNNAVQAIDGQGEIDIETEIDSKFLTIRIKDSGPGVSDENLDKIFEPMFTTKTTGTGLGLNIVKKIIAKHKDKITVEDNQPKGTNFILKLHIYG